MIPVCLRCGNLIARSNRAFPGYCTEGCRDQDPARRLNSRQRRRRAQRERDRARNEMP